jgi:hypothetical protein
MAEKLFAGQLIPGTKSKQSDATGEARAKLARVVEMKTSGMTYAEIAEELNCTVAYVHKRYKYAMSMVIVDKIDIVRKTETERLDHLYLEAIRVLNMQHPLVQQGRVVMTPLLDENGLPVLDGDNDGSPVMVPLEDVAPKLNAMSKILHIMERRAKLLGLDAPTKTAFTDPSGEKEAAAVQFYIPSNGRDVPQLPAPTEQKDE